MDEQNHTAVMPDQSEDAEIAHDAEIARKVLGRESRRRSTMLSVSLPACLLLGIVLFSSMKIESIYVVSGGAVAGLLVWAALINLVPLRRGGWAYKLLLTGDRTVAEEESLARHEGRTGGAHTSDSSDAGSSKLESETKSDPRS